MLLPFRRCAGFLGALVVSALLGTAGVPAAQLPEDPGPHKVGWDDVTFPDTVGGGMLTGRTYYPALSFAKKATPAVALGPYPLVTFHHGLGLDPTDYDDVCGHAASWGFVVLSIETDYALGNPYATMVVNQAHYARDMLAWMEGESKDRNGFYAGLAAGGPWAAVGHSMGGTSLPLLAALEPRVETLIALEPGSSALDAAALGAFGDDLFVVAGSLDTAVDPMPVFDGATAAERRLFADLQGAGHLGCIDNPPANEPMSAADQLRLHRRVVSGFLRAQVKGEEELFYHLLGEGIASEPVVLLSESDLAPYWCTPSLLQPGRLLTGLAATPADLAVFGVGKAPASIPSPFGTFGIDLALGYQLYSVFAVEPDGVTEQAFPVPANLSGITLWFQGFAAGADHQLLTRTVQLTLP